MHMRGSRKGGSRSVWQKKLWHFFFCFFSPQLILQKSHGQFQRNLSFFKVPEGVQHFPGGGGGGVQLFPGGSNSLFPIETHITCDFPGGGGQDPLSPPLDPHLMQMRENANDRKRFKLKFRVPIVREKSVKNEKSSRSGKSQGILSWGREIWNFGKSQRKVREFYNNNLSYFNVDNYYSLATDSGV